MFLGGPGSGKDTQIEKMRDTFDFTVISTGSISRKKAEEDPLIKKIVQEGSLIDNETMVEWLKEEIKSIDEDKSIILNGFPRNLDQAHKLEEIFKESDRVLTAVVYLEVPDVELKRRLLSRVYCSVCDKKVLLGREECLRCGGKIIKREDDNDAVIERRIDLFHKETMPLIKYFESEKKLLLVEADRPVEEIHSELIVKMELK